MTDRATKNGLFPTKAEVARMLSLLVRSINEGYRDQARTAADGLADMIRERQWAAHVALIGNHRWLHALPEALQDVREQMREGTIGVEALTRLREVEREARS